MLRRREHLARHIPQEPKTGLKSRSWSWGDESATPSKSLGRTQAGETLKEWKDKGEKV